MDFFDSAASPVLRELLNTPVFPQEKFLRVCAAADLKSEVAKVFNDLLLSIRSRKRANHFNSTNVAGIEKYIEFLMGLGAQNSCVLKVVQGDLGAIAKVQNIVTNDMCYKFFGPGFCEAVVYEFEPQDDYDVFNPDRKLVDKKSVSLTSADTLFLKAGIHAFRGGQVENLAILEFRAVTKHKIAWNFDPKSGKMMYPSAVDIAETRLASMLDIAAKLSDKSSVPYLRKRYHLSDYYFIKWKTIETAAHVCNDLTQELLLDAAHQQHPELKKAARQSLEMNGIPYG